MEGAPHEHEYEEGEVVDQSGDVCLGQQKQIQRQHSVKEKDNEDRTHQELTKYNRDAHAQLVTSASPSFASGAHGPQSDEELIAEFYRVHASPTRNPEDHARCLLSKYHGRMEELKLCLEQRYGVERWFDTYEYDFRCRFFNSARALYDPHVVPPLPNAPPLDNLAKTKLLVREKWCLCLVRSPCRVLEGKLISSAAS
eukprot:gb/GECG01009648.1/.p1 GENE.gb/GECG01009648.1/~~gb/GECG01009648.1/.p1  ORF type:complete len:198 (+),score=21.93 gb/GECG01009648.1/:1-594(+)